MNLIFAIKRKLHRCFILLLAVIAGLISACDNAPVVVDASLFERLYVFGVLSTAAKQQEIYLTATQYEGDPKPINDARVRMIGPTGEVELAAVGNGFYRDLDNRLQVTPGSAYQLRVKLRDGREASGQASVPSRFRILRPVMGDSIKAEQVSSNTKLVRVRAEWTAANGAWISRVQSYYNAASGLSFPASNQLTTQTALPFIFGITIPSTEQFTSFSLHVVHYDSAFTIYQIMREYFCYGDNPVDPSSPLPCDLVKRLRATYAKRGINLTGAEGVFAAVVADSVRFYVKP